MPRREKSTQGNLGRKASDSVLSMLSSSASEGELRGLGDEVVRAIRAELGRASSDSLDQVEEVLQNAFLNAYKILARRGRVGSLRPFFLALSRNEARRYVRQNLRRERLARNWSTVLGGEAQLSQEPPENEKVVVLDALSQLPIRHRRIIALLLIEGKSDAEVNSALKLSPGAFRTAKYRALKALRGVLEFASVTPESARTSKRKSDRKDGTERSARLRAAVEANPAFSAEISTLELLDDPALWNAARTRMPQADSERMEELHRRHRVTGLSEAETQELARLEQQYERVILVRSHSASLLEQRGHDIRKLTSSQQIRNLASGG